MAWQDDLQPASWRGVPFFVDTAVTTFGRNAALHAYPFRESGQVWVEDLGRAPAVMRITGFLIGDDVSDQQSRFLGAMQAPGRGELVHPIHGTQTGSIVGGCRLTFRKERMRYAEVEFEFVVNALDSPYPAAQPDTQSDVKAATGNGQAAAAATWQAQTNTQPSALLSNASPNFDPRAGELTGGI